VSELFGSVTFLSRKDAPDGEAAFITPEINHEELEEKCRGVQILGKIQLFNIGG
jgi:hypothetical protein